MTTDAGQGAGRGEPDPQEHRDEPVRQEHGDEPVRHLQRGQFVAETSRPVPRAALSARATAGLWALRIFVVLVSLMVIYTFIDQLR